MRGFLPALVLVACTGAAPTAEPRRSPAKTGVSKGDAKPPELPPAVRAGDDCSAKITAYLSERAALSRCETDSDCAEMWPGLCPHGPYYIHRDAEVEPVIAGERAIMDVCSVPECEPPMELGIARCDAGKCVAGRAAPVKKGDESCWDFRETYLEAGGGASETTVTAIRGVTPHLVIVPKDPGKLVLEVDWPQACADCRLVISEHNSGMSRVVEPKRSSVDANRNGDAVRRERLELAVTPGPYHMVALAKAAVGYSVRAELRDVSGAVGRVTRHGVGWQRMCEG